MVTNEDGHITQNVVYIPFGEMFVEERNGNWNTPYLFNAKELDEETGLYYYGARYLDPAGARWLSVDPMWENDPDKTPYNYCLNNPVKLVDPDGRLVWFAPVLEKAFEFLIAGSLIVAYKNYLTKRNEDEKNNDNSHYHESRGKNQNNQSTKSGQSSDTNTSSGKGLKNSDKIKEGKDFEAKELENARKKGKKVSSQTRLVPQNKKGNVKGNRTNADQLIKNEDTNDYSLVETKRSSSSRLSKGQKSAKEHVENGDGIFEVRSRDPIQDLRPGDKIKIRDYKRIDKYPSNKEK
ncbi:MAG: RHS repeat-associated core domain-containing protein [Paludibacteraceae bacterium]|nr:RHS repeat-associated core domain-containing protein [Paludibacteraceae bacterium]